MPEQRQLLQHLLARQQVGGAIHNVLGGGLRAAGPAAAQVGGGGAAWSGKSQTELADCLQLFTPPSASAPSDTAPPPNTHQQHPHPT